MGLRIQNNIAAMNAHRNLQIADSGMSKSLERLSSGYRINKAADDAAGLAVSSGMRADIASYKVASRNTSEAIALLQVAEGAYDQISNILTRLKELATQGTSANASENTSDINNEVTALKAEIDRIANATEYNGQAVLKGYGTVVYSATAGLSLANGYDGVTLSGVSDNEAYTITTTTAGAVTLTHGTDTETHASANGAQTINFASMGVSLNTNSAYVATAEAFDSATLKFSAAGGDFVTGIKDSDDHRINVTIDQVSTTLLTLTAVNGTTTSDLDTINTAIDTLAASRAKIGASMNRLSYAAANLASSIENVQAAESVIRDVDMAAEMTTFTKNQILLQAGTSMLAQANMAPQGVLSLFQ
ncbi:MAG: flagellin N-terminal helical domain-containing protein [Syntrophales bacterium]